MNYIPNFSCSAALDLDTKVSRSLQLNIPRVKQYYSRSEKWAIPSLAPFSRQNSHYSIFLNFRFIGIINDVILFLDSHVTTKLAHLASRKLLKVRTFLVHLLGAFSICERFNNTKKESALTPKWGRYFVLRRWHWPSCFYSLKRPTPVSESWGRL